jgi:dolichol-phosphate mannosyltransferase
VTERKTFSIVMPCYNESEGISEFLNEIVMAMGTLCGEIYVIDDNSSDSTSRIVKDFSSLHRNIHLIKNTKNLGHGPSTIFGLRYLVNRGHPYIISIDGDGQFFGEDIARTASRFGMHSEDIMECSRLNRGDPVFRRIATLATKLIVFVKTFKQPSDANTPFRIYKLEVLSELLKRVPENSPVPNLEFSILARKLGYKIVEEKVRSRSRRADSIVGSTWQSKQNIIPSRRFIMFCMRALKRMALM